MILKIDYFTFLFNYLILSFFLHSNLIRYFSTRENNIRKRHEFNVNNESDFLNNRNFTIEGKKNPWERVVENIEIRESDYKGTKDVSRMRTVILNRKGDFNQMKMK